MVEIAIRCQPALIGMQQDTIQAKMKNQINKMKQEKHELNRTDSIGIESNQIKPIRTEKNRKKSAQITIISPLIFWNVGGTFFIGIGR